MSKTRASADELPQPKLRTRASWFDRRDSPLLCNGSIENKFVRLGTLDPAHVMMAKRTIRPLIVVAVLGLCMLAAGQALSAQFCALGLVSFFVAASILRPLDPHHDTGFEHTKRILPQLLLEWLCVIAVLGFLAVALKLTSTFSARLIADWFLGTPFALVLVESLSIPVANRLSSERRRAQRCIIIGVNDVGLEFARRIERVKGAGKFVGFFDYRSAERLPEVPGQQVTANCQAHDFAEFVRNNSISHVYIALPISTTPRIEDLLSELRDTTASVYFVPNIFAFDLVQARCVEINGMPAFSICESPLSGTSGLWKRALDIFLAFGALLLIWPVLLAIAILVKQSSPGPVLFKQRRYGLHGEEILVYKFRSMTVCEDGAIVAQATILDRRITPIGRFLRRTSLDELPQIYNVLEGKMSFVGPRPHAVAHNEEYRKLINGYMIRHKVRPGITGWAQINGLRGETATVDKMRLRVQYDLDYLKNWSFWLDVKILARTVFTVLNDSNAY